MQNTRLIVTQDRPEADPTIRFLAHFDGYPNGVHGLGATVTAAEEDLAVMDEECAAGRLDMAEHGELPWYLS